MCYSSFQDFCELNRDYNTVPVYSEKLLDMETPVSVYKKIRTSGPSFLLESVEGGENLARYSFCGLDPLLVYTFKDEKGVVKYCFDRRDMKAVCETDEFKESPFTTLPRLIQQCKGPKLEGLPRFYGGAVGYFGYDLVRFLEKLPSKNENDLQVPDCMFVFPGTVLIFDHVKHTLKVVVNNLKSHNLRRAYEQAVEKIDSIFEKVESNGNTFCTDCSVCSGSARRFTYPETFESNMTRDDFLEKVKVAREHILAGDIIQAVISQRFRVPFCGDPFNIYRHLRSVNPSPYMYYLDFGEPVLAGSSPEMLVRVEDNVIKTCPIAGTRPRGKNGTADGAMAEELLGDEKERAEHLMLVDLARNDLGRVCAPRTINLARFMDVERYSHVMHLVSEVHGKLARGRSAFDGLKACFPAGTVSGAPKIRAMEIIEELETVRRGVYAGAVGYIGFNGNLDTAITIRTVLFSKGYAYVQAGAGIVADSVPEREYEETLNKARALLEILTGGGSVQNTGYR